MHINKYVHTKINYFFQPPPPNIMDVVNFNGGGNQQILI